MRDHWKDRYNELLAVDELLKETNAELHARLSALTGRATDVVNRLYDYQFGGDEKWLDLYIAVDEMKQVLGDAHPTEKGGADETSK